MATEFKLDGNEKIKASVQNAPTGFKHVVKFYRGDNLVQSRQVSYYNRTWESYKYSSAINMLMEKMIKKNQITKEQAKRVVQITSGQAKARVDSMFKTTSNVAMMGEVFGQTKKEKNDWKLKMLVAGNPGLQIPNDWDNLSETEKESRLNRIIKFIGK